MTAHQNIHALFRHPVLNDMAWQDDVERELVTRTASVMQSLARRMAGHPEIGPLVTAVGAPFAFTRNNRLHRDDGPALIYQDGHKVWYQDGAMHRADGPAVIIERRMKWFWRGKLHNWAEPAVQGYTKTGERIERWFVHGEDITDVATSWLVKREIYFWPLTEAEQFVFAVHFGDRGR